jgi:hypothetical protein
MTIASYADLKRAIVDWANKPEIEQAVGSFVQFAEARFNRELRTQQQIARKRATSDQQFVALPEDWLEAKNIQLNTDPPRRLQFVTLDEADEMRARGSLTHVSFYSIAGLSLELLPTPDSDVEIEMIYWRTIPPLSDAEPTNWLLSRAPDLYLHAALLQASAYLETDARVPLWEAAVTQTINNLNMEAQRAAVSGSTLVRRMRSFG